MHLQWQAPVQLDPHISGGINLSLAGYGFTCHSLLRLSDDKDCGKTEVEPYLAVFWSQPNPTTYLFNLRKGVKWQNLPPLNGRDLNADDVVYSIKRETQGDPRFTMAALFDEVTSIEAVDKYTVKMTTKYPLLYKFGTADGSPIVPKGLDAKTIANTAIGTGPFVPDAFTLTRLRPTDPRSW